MPELSLPVVVSPPRRALLDVPPAELRAWLAERGQPAMRVKQLRRWLLAGRATSFDQMTDLPRSLRQELADSFAPLSTRLDRALVSSDGTEKLLLRLDDGQLVECVLLKEADRRT